jgi:hypothetical protein
MSSKIWRLHGIMQHKSKKLLEMKLKKAATTVEQGVEETLTYMN